MKNKVKDFYDTYKDYGEVLYSEIRKETYGEDIGQNSWLTADEYRGFIDLLQISPKQNILEVASGSGGPAVFLVKSTGCFLTGIDINEQGILHAMKLAAENGLSENMNFILTNAATTLPFQDASFDAILSIDSVNHLPDRAQFFHECMRVLKSGGKFLFTDAVVITGVLSNEEIALRSALGFFLFVPNGENERLLEETGFKNIHTQDVTENIIRTSNSWLVARQKRKTALLEYEDEEKFNGIQTFLKTTHQVSKDRRLSRFMYCCEK